MWQCGNEIHLKQTPFFPPSRALGSDSREGLIPGAVLHQLEVPLNECQLLSTLVPVDRCFIRAELSFAHATLKTVPLITCEEVGDPLLSLHLPLSLPHSPAGGSGKWGLKGGGHSLTFTVSTPLLDGEAGRRREGGARGKQKRKRKKYQTPR